MSVSNTIDADLDAEFRFSEENYLHLICPRTKKVCISCSEVALESTIERVGREGLEPRRASILAKGGFKEALQFLEGVKPYWMVERGDMTCEERKNFLTEAAVELTLRGVPELKERELVIVSRGSTPVEIA